MAYNSVEYSNDSVAVKDVGAGQKLVFCGKMKPQSKWCLQLRLEISLMQNEFVNRFTSFRASERVFLISFGQGYRLPMGSRAEREMKK